MISSLSCALILKSVSSRSFIFLLFFIAKVKGWKQCEGGGVCPDFATCCPSARPGVSSCISMRYNKDPDDAKGECCDETIGCPYGFSCSVRLDENPEVHLQSDWKVHGSGLDSSKATQHRQSYCKIDQENPPTELFHDQPGYKMCQIPNPSMTTKLRRFPIIPEVSQGKEGTDEQQRRRPLPAHPLAYYSSHGDLFECDDDTKNSKDETSSSSLSSSNNKTQIRKALVMIHGSLRNADDYLCVAHSLIPQAERGSVLIVAPLFLAPSDLKQKGKHHQHHHQFQNQTQFLYWQNHEKQPKYPISHSWRYGADALNAPVSSYEALDRLVEHLVSFTAPGTDSNRCFPNLQQVTIVGHSAGGQLVHRWALLSNALRIPWTINENMDIRAVVANPRSYCYLNEKRMMMMMDGDKTAAQWKVPTASQIQKCPDYNQWTWGLESGGALDKVVPYKVRRLKEIMSAEELAHRYASRKVLYLTGEYDDIEQDDVCGDRDFQGMNRHERALYYVASLNAYFGTATTSNSTTILGASSSNNTTDNSILLRHELHTIPKTPHDHILMFQSAAGRRAIIEPIK